MVKAISRLPNNICIIIHSRRKRHKTLEMKKDLKKVINEVKMDYPKLTFRLSVIGFIASLGFYLGVLRDLRPTKEKAKIEQLINEKQRLEQQVDLLTEKLEATSID